MDPNDRDMSRSFKMQSGESMEAPPMLKDSNAPKSRDTRLGHCTGKDDIMARSCRWL